MRLDPTLVKIAQSIFALLKYTSSSLYQANLLEESVENCCDYQLSIVESYLKEKRIGLKKTSILKIIITLKGNRELIKR